MGAVPAPAQPTPTGEEVLAAVRKAARRLVDLQEAYDPQGDGHRPRRGFDARADREAAARRIARKKDRHRAEWPYEGVYRVRGAIPPGYRVGGTAICAWALIEGPEYAKEPAQKAAVERGLGFIVHALETDPLLETGFLGSYDVRGWGHAYALSFLLRALDKDVVPAGLRTRVRDLCRRLVKTLEEDAIEEPGGWNYARRSPKRAIPSTFMTAATLQALFAARSHGIPVDRDVVERALGTLEAARLDSGAFQYATSSRKTGRGFEAVAGACARMAICETTLHLAGRGSAARIRGAVEAFFQNWEWLEKRRRQRGTHIPPYMIAPYYFHFGHTYVAQAIEQLPQADRPRFRRRLRALYWKTREKSGGWNDRVFERSENYGSAMAILGLLMPGLPPPAPWESAPPKTPKKK